MDVVISILEEKHLPLVDAFSCTETTEELKAKGYNSNTRRKIIRHSTEMETFLKDEALVDQDKGLNKTHLLIYKDENNVEDIAAYISLCNDSVQLELDEKQELEFAYSSIPALKIARLAVNNKYKGKGIGKYMIELAAFKALEIRENSGLVFINLDCYEHRRSYYEQIGFEENQIQLNQRDFDSPISMRIVLDTFLETLA